jgi:energy-coupling factor transporter ATP-binding protein EcfA2
MLEYHVFNTYEELAIKLGEITGFAPPQVLKGRRKFFNDFTLWLINSVGNKRNGTERTWRCIFPNPKFGLSYPYPIDDLKIQLNTNGEYDYTRILNSILLEFELEDQVINRPSTALSGGEIFLVNLAKLSIVDECSTDLIICTPTQWLNKNKYYLVQKLIDIWNKQGKNVFILALEGEELMGNETNLEPSKEIENSIITWHLIIKSLKIRFEEKAFPKPVEEKVIFYHTENDELSMNSPALLIGNNGVGKSIFAKILAGIESPSEGEARIITNGVTGNARLILQDNLIQLFGEEIESHFNRVFKYDPELGKKVLDTYNEIINRLQQAISLNGDINGVAHFDIDEENTSVIQIKAALIAERISKKTSLLILDEPEWLLSRKMANIFITQIIEICHERHIPVLIITHLSDWYNFECDKIIMQKTYENNVRILKAE